MATLFDDTFVHDIAVRYDQAAYDSMIATFKASGDKEWIVAGVTIDGVTYEEVGLRLKGNSSLAGLGGMAGPGGRQGGPGGGGPGGAAAPGGPGGGASAEDPEALPWLIRLDKYVDDQEHSGVRSFVVRSNVSETSLNEAVALALVDEAGLASQRAIAASFRVNDRPAKLRLVIENPDDVWMTANFSAGGALYKAESTGDYSYRGDDPVSYDEVFDQEAGKDNADLTPLIEFLDVINNAEDTTFASQLPQRLDVDGFARYLAVQELLGNFDDIDGPGNNSYLYYDPDAEQFTVVTWDLNLALRGSMGPGGAPVSAAGAPPREGFEPPEGFPVPDGFQPPAGAPGGAAMPGRFGRSNVLVERFHAEPTFEARYQQQLTELRAKLFTSGFAEEVLAEWAELLRREAGDLVDDATLSSEVAAISTQFKPES